MPPNLKLEAYLIDCYKTMRCIAVHLPLHSQPWIMQRIFARIIN